MLRLGGYNEVRRSENSLLLKKDDGYKVFFTFSISKECKVPEGSLRHLIKRLGNFGLNFKVIFLSSHTY